MICENCGLRNPDGFKFCPRCGAVLDKPVKIDRSKIRGPGEAIAKAIKARGSTDEIVTTSWIWVMIIVYLASYVASLAIGLSIVHDVLQQDPSTFSREQVFDEMRTDLWALALLSGMFYSIASILAYLLVRRLNRHFTRDTELRAAALSLITSAASSPELSQRVENELAAMNRTDNLIASTEKRRRPILWSLAVAAPLMVSALQWALIFTSDSYSEYQRTSALFAVASLLSYLPLFDLSYFLGKSIYDHHSRWMDFAGQTTAAMNKLGLKMTEPLLDKSLLRRPYGLYVLVTIVTLGFFMFYWWHTLIQDPNYHFKAQWYFEDCLIKSIRD